MRQPINTDADEFVLTSDRLYVCENPAVFMEVAGQLCEESQPLMCTEGQPSAAFWALMKRVEKTDVRVHADFDWAGLRIAGAVIEQCAASPWRFGTIDYEKAAVQYDGLQLSGSASSSPWDPTLAHALATHERVIYEEQVIDDLLEDLRRGAKHDNSA